MNKLRGQLPDVALLFSERQLQNPLQLLLFSLLLPANPSPKRHKMLILGGAQGLNPPPSPVQLLLLPTGQLHGDAQLFVEAGRHAEVS